jgi:hypothetical protein
MSGGPVAAWEGQFFHIYSNHQTWGSGLKNLSGALPSNAMHHNRDRECPWDPDCEAVHLPQLTESDLGEYKEGAGGQQEVVEGLGVVEEPEGQGEIEGCELVAEVDVWELHFPQVSFHQPEQSCYRG